jgi:hypothetical protein
MSQMGWWGEMGGPKQKGVVQYSTSTSRSIPPFGGGYAIRPTRLTI